MKFNTDSENEKKVNKNLQKLNLSDKAERFLTVAAGGFY